MEHSNPYRRYYELAEKWHDGKISPAELEELDAWFRKDQDLPVEIPPSFAADEKEHARRILAAIRAKQVRHMPVRHTWGWLRAAAAIAFLLLGAGGWYYFSRSADTVQVADTQHQPLYDALLGRFQARLTLANGQEILLDSTASGELARQGDIRIIGQPGQLHYDGRSADAPTKSLHNTITTARGETYALTLADGTKVWLNASSSIRFPVTFIGGRRQVEITGEAYFEVVADGGNHFVVAAGNTETVVLGTHFNVSSYADEGAVRISLLEGKVLVNQSATLLPGQQASVSNGHVKVVDLEDPGQTIAWKEGMFDFDNSDLRTVMRQLSRWYDLDVEYPVVLPKEHFSGRISRNMNASKVLKVLEYSGVRFRIEGRKIMVYP